MRGSQGDTRRAWGGAGGHSLTRVDTHVPAQLVGQVEPLGAAALGTLLGAAVTVNPINVGLGVTEVRGEHGGEGGGGARGEPQKGVLGGEGAAPGSCGGCQRPARSRRRGSRGAPAPRRGLGRGPSCSAAAWNVTAWGEPPALPAPHPPRRPRLGAGAHPIPLAVLKCSQTPSRAPSSSSSPPPASPGCSAHP